jgi:hypothetical protein
MTNQLKLAAAAQFVKATFEGREFLLTCLDEARLAGRKKEIRSWECRLREIDAFISKYGMERYACRIQA